MVVTAPPPTSVTAGTGFGFQVEAQDANGDLDTQFNGPVTLVLSNFSGGPHFQAGLTTVNAVNGVATFSGLELDQAVPMGFSLRAAHRPRERRVSASSPPPLPSSRSRISPRSLFFFFFF